MHKYTVGVIPGSEAGAFVVAEALRVARAVGVTITDRVINVGPDRYRQTGDVLTEDDLSALRGTNAVFVGAPPVSGATDIPAGLLERGIIFGLRRSLDLGVNLRIFRGVGAHEGIDIAVVRENSEGGYVGEGGVLREGTEMEIATQGSVNTWFGVQRCLRFAFETARSRKRRLILAHKVRVLTFAGSLWQRALAEVGRDFPDVQTTYENIDICCAHMVEDPRRYDVIVADNMFGDILSDIACTVACASDYAASAELNVARTGPSMFEPMHSHTVYDADVSGNQNPRPGINAIAMMLDYLGDHLTGAALAHAVLAHAAQDATSEGGNRGAETSDEIIELAAAALERDSGRMRAETAG